ncbi:SprT-like domain-containing protein [Oscillospiraceae bacterium 50-58]
MPDKTTLTPVLEKLEDLFSKLNSEFYGGKLQAPVITVSPDTTKGAYGWCTGWKAWTDKAPKPLSEMTPEEIKAAETDGYYEINLCAEHIARPFMDTVGTLLHEMAHLYNCQMGIQDTSRGGFYHNKKFKETAEAHGLIVEKNPKYGYSKTILTDEAKAFIKSLDDCKFDLYRKAIPHIGGSKKSNSSRKYVCPCCGAIVRATKEVNIVCGDCDAPFEEETE